MAEGAVSDVSSGIYLKTDKLGRTSVQGLHETRRKLMAMGMDRNHFERLIKEAALIVARKATEKAPVVSGKLAESIRGQASKKFSKTIRSSGLSGAFGGTTTVAMRAFGGVVLGRTPYARATSYGTFHKAGEKAKSNTSSRATRVWRTTVRGKANPYMVEARNQSKPAIVRHFEIEIKKWIREEGF